MLKQFNGAAIAFFLAVTITAPGCVVSSGVTPVSHTKPYQQRDALASAVDAVEAAPWPQPESISLFGRITGSDSANRVSRNDALAAYVNQLSGGESGVIRLKSDVSENLRAAAALNAMGLSVANSPQLSIHDVELIEGAIKALRENRHIYTAAAKELKKRGAPVDDHTIGAMRDSYGDAIRTLGDTADILADRLDADNTGAFAAAPAGPAANAEE